MRILVTGGAGYIGSHTCVELINNGYDIIIADNLSNSSEEAIRRIEGITGKKVNFYKMDIRNREQLSRIFEEHEIDCVIHFAGLKAVGESVLKPLDYYDNNLNSTLAVCEAMGRYGVKRLVFSSSATVYRADNTMPLKEEAATGCTNPYGWTKYMCEQIIRDAARAFEDWSVLLLRYFNPVGAHESGLIGEDPAGIPNNLMPFISQTAIGRREKLLVFGNDYPTADKTGVRDYIHVTDLAIGHIRAVEYSRNHPGVEAVNLGTGSGTSVLQMIKAFEQVNGVSVPYEFTGRRSGDLGICYADPSKARRMLNWHTTKSLSEMCADAWRWQCRNPKGYQ